MGEARWGRMVPLVLWVMVGVLGGREYYRWEPIESPGFRAPRIISARDTSDFWILDQKGFLYHYQRGTWTRYAVPGHQPLTDYRATEVTPGTFLVSGYDENWRTSFFWFRKGRWRRDSLEIQSPIKILVTLRPGLVYAAGDWATLYRYRQGEWERIALPFSSHFRLVAFSEQEIYLTTRGEGIYRFDGRKIEKLPVQTDEVLEVSRVARDSSGQLYFASGTGQVFRWDGQTFRPTTRPFPETRRDSFQYVEWKGVRLPNQFLIRQLFPVRDDLALFVSARGKLYRNRRVAQHYFVNFSEKFHLNRIEQVPISGAYFFYWNEDRYPDLYLMTHSPYENWKFYVSNPGRPFENVTHQTGFVARPGYYQSLPVDLNGDGRTDLAVLELTRNGNLLHYFFQGRDYRFFHYDSLAFYPHYSPKGFTDMYSGDFDGNGLADLGISTYFDRHLKKGFQVLLYNQLQAVRLDTVVLRKEARGYTRHVIWADFNSDGENDLLLVNQWKQMSLLLKESAGKRFATRDLPTQAEEAPAGAVAFDYDNDGDLDILYSSDQHSLFLLTNRGEARFDTTFQPAGFRVVTRQRFPFPIQRFLTVADVNNDGFEDIFFSVGDVRDPRNYLFINNAGRDFREEAARYGIETPAVQAAICGDVDRDGDLDLFAYNAEANFLWINNLDNAAFIELFLRGVKSNRDALGARVWLYPAGHLGEQNRLLAYRQLGSELFASRHANQTMVHLGVDPHGRYDLRVQFYHGATRVFRQVAPGRVIVVQELGATAAWLYSLPGRIVRFFAARTNQIYFVLTLLTGLFLFITLRLGAAMLSWKHSTSLVIVLYNITLYWIFLLSNLSSTRPLYKYGFPVGVVMLNVLFIFAYSYASRLSWFSLKSREQREEELLKAVLFFNHGEFGSKNLVSLQLLLNNPPESPEKWDPYLQRVWERLRIFKEYNIPVMKRLVKILEELRAHPAEVKELQEQMVFFGQLSRGDLPHVHESLRSEINRTYTLIRYLKRNVFKQFSCNPEAVVMQLVKALDNPVNLAVYKNYTDPLQAFIRREELYFILDNLLQNARKAIQDTPDGYLRIHILKKSPVIEIEVRDNGTGLSAAQRQALFRPVRGSRTGSGIGLAYSKTILEKYQGTIRLKEAGGARETVFSIELKEIS